AGGGRHVDLAGASPLALRRERLRKSIVSTLAVLACFSVAACGGSGSPAAPSVPVPPPVTAARFSVTQSGTPLLGLSPTHFNFRLKFDVTIAESAGLGGHVNYVRLSLTKAGREIERSEINANEISPNNVVRASSSTNYTVKMD